MTRRPEDGAKPDPPAAEEPGPTALPEARFRELLAAVVERILPLSPPGRGEADEAAAAIAAKIGPPDGSDLRRMVEAALLTLDGSARFGWDKGFAALGPAARDALLGELEDEDTPLARRFFHVMVILTLDACCGGPRRGGALGRRTWRHLGYDPEPGGRTGASGAGQEWMP